MGHLYIIATVSCAHSNTKSLLHLVSICADNALERRFVTCDENRNWSKSQP